MPKFLRLPRWKKIFDEIRNNALLINPPQSMTELRKKTDSSTSYISVAIKSLEREGYIRTEKIGKCRYVGLTDKGLTAEFPYD